jgi:hypothetical protein
MALRTIKAKVRKLIDDLPTTHTDVYSYNGIDYFILREANVVSVESVSVNGQSSGISYTFDSTSNRVTINSGITLRTNDLIEITYTCYINFSETQLDGYVSCALDYLAIYYKVFIIETDERSGAESGVSEIFPTTTFAEDSLIAIVTSILINPKNVAISIPDVKIGPAEKSSTDQIIQRQIALYKKHNSKDSYGVI